MTEIGRRRCSYELAQQGVCIATIREERSITTANLIIFYESYENAIVYLS